MQTERKTNRVTPITRRERPTTANLIYAVVIRKVGGEMSELGQKRMLHVSRVMTALQPSQPYVPLSVCSDSFACLDVEYSGNTPQQGWLNHPFRRP
jgi:hypothetical protein